MMDDGTANRFRAMQQAFRETFSEDELKVIEEIRSIQETRGRHPLVGLLYSARDEFEYQHLLNIIECCNTIHRVNPKWLLSSKIRSRLLSSTIHECEGLLGELKVYGYLLQAFPGTEPIPVSKVKKTPDFRVPHYLRENTEEVFIEVHSMAWSERMEKEMQKHEIDFRDGKVGIERQLPGGKVRTSFQVVTPLSGDNRATSTQDGISKIAKIGEKSNQFPANSACVLWLNLEQDGWQMTLSLDDCLPLYSKGRGDIRSGILWNSLYGVKGLPLYEVYPDQKVLSMRHNGMFSNFPAVSAVMANFGREIVLFENPDSANPIPHWFRAQCFNLKWFQLQYSRIIAPGFALKKQIEAELSLCCTMKNIDVMAEW